MRRPRVVLLATAVGYDGVPHAGGNYLRALYEVLARHSTATVISPGSATNRAAAARQGAPPGLLLLGLEPGGGPIRRATNRWSLNLDTRLRRLDPGMPYLPLLVGLARSGEARRAIREADVIDLQWSDSIRLVRILRLINPRARIVGTFYDVMSQSFAREPQRTLRERVYWQSVAARSRRHERLLCRRVDEVLAFSEKDLVLLGSPRNGRVVRPPLATGREVRHRLARGGSGTVLVVSYLARDENNKAALWALREVWPGVLARVPGARLRFVGSGASADLQAAASHHNSVELAGFLADLDEVYASAAVCLVPVLQGAGVKFKTIEALLHGVPTVTTTVGAEGVGGSERFAGVVDSADGLTKALVAVLCDLPSAQARADLSQDWALDAFGVGTFEEQIQASWRQRTS